MAKVKLGIVGSLQNIDGEREETLDAENVAEISRKIESKYPQDHYFNFNVFLNGISVNDRSEKNLIDGDEVVVVPIMSGG